MKSDTADPLIVIVAGEASGDLLGAEIILALKKNYPTARFVGITGPRMNAQGCESLYSIDDLSVMLIVEILPRLCSLLKIRRRLIEYCLREKPMVYIGVDAPAFNLPIERRLRSAALKTVHYNSPKIWAWRYKRIWKIAKSCSLMLTQFPFEKELYDEKNIPAEYVGHPLADLIPLDSDRVAARRHLNLPLDAKILAILPGSRSHEIISLTEPMLKAAAICKEHLQNLIFIVPMINSTRQAQFENIVKASGIQLHFQVFIGQSQEVMAASDAMLIASGTATLEAMLINRPMVVAYKVNPITFFFLKCMVHANYISLPNIIAGQALIPELIQDEVNPIQLSNAVLPSLLDETFANKNHTRFRDLHLKLKKNAMVQAANAIALLCKT